MPKQATKCDEMIVQLIVRTYDEYGRVIGEAVTQPAKVFRAATPDWWTHVDGLIKVDARAIAAAPPPAAPPARARGKQGSSR